MHKLFTNYLYDIKSIKFIPKLFILKFLIITSLSAQTFSVTGRVTASRFPVANASITFIDLSDTTNKYSTLTDATGNYQISIITSVESNLNNLPTNFKLEQSYPNPFSSSTAIPYQLKNESDVQITIFDILGRVVKNFNVGLKNSGLHNVLWDGRNSIGQRVANGIYFYRLQSGGESQVKKMIFNEAGRGHVSFPNLNYSQSSTSNWFNKQNITTGNYKIRIDNTADTRPLVVPKQYDNVILQRDTTISFSVDYTSVADISVDISLQKIQGFGAANIVGWRPDMTVDEIEKAFGTEEGQLGFTILRLRISPNPNDWIRNVTSAKAAYEKGVKIIAAPWTPPANMKTNNNLIGGELREDAYNDFAEHLKSFKDFMADNGVPIYAISVQNEPDISVDYESCDYSPDQMVKFMRENAPNIGTKVMAPESFQFRKNMSDPLLNDSLACANLDIVAGHIYGGGLVSYPLAEEKGKEIWMTEHLTESAHSANVWSYAIEVAKEMNDVMKAGMNAYVWWYIVRYYGPIGDGEISTSFPNEPFPQKGEVTKKGYVMSQFARFIRPNYYRVESNVFPPSVGSGVDVTAYKDPESSKIVIVALNTSSTPKEQVFRFQNNNLFTNFIPYTTSAAKNCEQGEEFTTSSGSFTFTLEPSSITTFVSN